MAEITSSHLALAVYRLEEQVKTIDAHIISGQGVDNMESYRYMTGQRQGLLSAIELIADADRQLAKE